MRKLIDIVESDYRGQHGAPDREDGAPLYSLISGEIYPADVYGPNGRRYYAADTPEAYSICRAFAGRPNKMITIYRAVPKSLHGSKITPGDWVTITRAYAREHGRESLNNDFKILTKTVSARDIYTAGDSLDEWGYDPQPFISRQEEDAIRVSLGMQTVADARAAHKARVAALSRE